MTIIQLITNFTPRTTATNDIGVEADKHTAINMQFLFYCFFSKRKNPVKRINFWKFEDWNIETLCRLTCWLWKGMSPTTKTTQLGTWGLWKGLLTRPLMSPTTQQNLRAMEGSNETPYEPPSNLGISSDSAEKPLIEHPSQNCLASKRKECMSSWNWNNRHPLTRHSRTRNCAQPLNECVAGYWSRLREGLWRVLLPNVHFGCKINVRRGTGLEFRTCNILAAYCEPCDWWKRLLSCW